MPQETNEFLKPNDELVKFIATSSGDDTEAPSLTLYLERCQIDTPPSIVDTVWQKVLKLRKEIGKAVDFGAGDGRFSLGGKYSQYIGYEIDPTRSLIPLSGTNAQIINRCAFSDTFDDADLSIGNPPYVRNQDLPDGWRNNAAEILKNRLPNVKISGLANAWQYFFLLSLVSTKSDGLIALVIPFEWVSRPASASLREYIRSQRWAVDVYRLKDGAFDNVLTTASITIVDKRVTRDEWNYFDEKDSGDFIKIPSPSGSDSGVIPYKKSGSSKADPIRFKRGLSPGTQELLLLTETQRINSGLIQGSDVVPCVKSLRNIDESITELTPDLFRRLFIETNLKCWLINTDRTPSKNLAAYLNNVDIRLTQTKTCLEREHWWQFVMPSTPLALIASGFRGARPKFVINTVGAKAVGSVCGLHGFSMDAAILIIESFSRLDLSKRVVGHSHGLKKLEINQLNTILELIK